MIFSWRATRDRELAGADGAQSETLASMRSEADALILDIWNQVERKYAEVMPNENVWSCVALMA